MKVNAVELLRRELADKRYKPKPIAMGTNTDPYQPAEREHKLTRGILEVLLETQAPGDRSSPSRRWWCATSTS